MKANQPPPLLPSAVKRQPLGGLHRLPVPWGVCGGRGVGGAGAGGGGDGALPSAARPRGALAGGSGPGRSSARMRTTAAFLAVTRLNSQKFRQITAGM